MSVKKLILIALLFCGFSLSVSAEGVKGDPEVQYKYQFGVNMQIKLIKGLNLNLEPEIRFNDGYDKLHLNGGLTYKMFGCLYLGGTYRFVVDRVEAASSSSSYSMFSYNTNNYDSELYHRYAFDLTYKDKFGRFTPSFRLRYNNFADDEVTDREFMRYRGKVEYDIRKCKITPFVSIEAYQELSEGLLYKMRYSTGFDVKSGKNSSFSFDYKFDFFTLEYKNANVFSVGYKHKF